MKNFINRWTWNENNNGADNVILKEVADNTSGSKTPTSNVLLPSLGIPTKEKTRVNKI